MYIENSNRASQEAVFTQNNIEPNPKNPIIASFFRNIGYADQLGSGVRKLFKYSKYYSGKDPQFVENDIFRIIVPLDENCSYDFRSDDGMMTATLRVKRIKLRLLIAILGQRSNWKLSN